jgi:hypothetical protein
MPPLQPLLAEHAPWPKLLTPPAALLDWLHEQKNKDPVEARHFLTMRWLVLAELARTAPEPPKNPVL